MLGSQLHDGGGLHIATFSWDRLIVDPLPGPRQTSDFVGLEPVGERNYHVLPRTTLQPPAASTLPRLAAQLPARLYLLDPYLGALGLRAQLAELVELLKVDEVIVVDVGGDIIAAGDEPTVRSPLGDALMLAAVQGLPVEATIAVAGPGLDGELTEAEVISRCQQLADSSQVDTLSASTTRPYGTVFEWHLSEASGLLRAAALGVRGVVEIRDRGAQVGLTSNSPVVWRLSAGRALSINRLAQALLESSSFDAAEHMVLSLSGKSEMTYEREKARTLDLRSTAPAPEVDHTARLATLENEAKSRGADFVTLRRLAEVLQVPRVQFSALWATLVALDPDRSFPPLRAVHDAAARSIRDARRPILMRAPLDGSAATKWTKRQKGIAQNIANQLAQMAVGWEFMFVGPSLVHEPDTGTIIIDAVEATGHVHGSPAALSMAGKINDWLSHELERSGLPVTSLTACVTISYSRRPEAKRDVVELTAVAKITSDQGWAESTFQNSQPLLRQL